jgi:hypothetical protein
MSTKFLPGHSPDDLDQSEKIKFEERRKENPSARSLFELRPCREDFDLRSFRDSVRMSETLTKDEFYFYTTRRTTLELVMI